MFNQFHTSIDTGYYYLLKQTKKLISQWTFKQIDASIKSFLLFSNFSVITNWNYFFRVYPCRGRKTSRRILQTSSVYKRMTCSHLLRSVSVHAINEMEFSIPRVSFTVSISLARICYTNSHTHTQIRIWNIQCDQVRTTMNEIIVRVIEPRTKYGCSVDESSGETYVKNKVPNLNFRGKLI